MVISKLIIIYITKKLEKAQKSFKKIIEFLVKIAQKNQFFSFRLDSPEPNFIFFCHSNKVVKNYKILIETNRDKKVIALFPINRPF
jgi:hypothetical protein